MHYLHIVRVCADSKEDAIDAVHCALDDFSDVVYDWYIIGGRWDGYFDGKNTLCFKDNKELFFNELTKIKNRQDEKFVDLINRFNGTAVKESQVGDSIFGLPIQDKLTFAENRTKQNEQFHSLWKKILNSKTVPSLDVNETLICYYLRNIAYMLEGYYWSGSGFYDAERYSAKPDIDTVFCDEDWLVAVDIHS